VVELNTIASHIVLSAVSKGPANVLYALFITPTTIPNENDIDEHVATEANKAAVRVFIFVN
jgi:hypothetical protein